MSRFFRPEFFNRLDSVVTFRALEPADVEAIARKELAELAAREGVAASGLKLAFAERVVSAVARAGYDRRLGARPLQRAIERMVVTPLARWKAAHPSACGITLKVDIGSNETMKIQAE